MFGIFARFSALLLRDQVQGAVRGFQTQLLQWVKKDIDALQDKFKVHMLQHCLCMHNLCVSFPNT